MKYLLILVVFLLPALVLAQGYKPIIGIPGITDPGTDFNQYINTLYALSISIAALLAVIKITIAGVKWMMSDIVTSKADAKKEIKGALIGLLIVLGAVLILTVINPNLTTVNLSLDIGATGGYSDDTSVPALDTSLVNSTNISGGAIVDYLNSNAPYEQKNSFLKACGLGGGIPQVLTGNEYRCLKVGTAQSIKVVRDLTAGSGTASNYCGNPDPGIPAGIFTDDAIISGSSIGYCVVP